MSKYFKLIVLPSLLMILVMNGYSQTQRIGFFINIAGFFPTQENINAGYGSGLGGVFFLNPDISISFEWKYSRFSVDEEEGKFVDGTLTVTPLLASVHYNLRMIETFSPYIFFGGGPFFSSLRLSRQRDPEETNIQKQKIKTGIGFYGGIGSTLKLTERLSLFFEGLYLRRTTDAETVYFDNSAGSTFRVNLSSFSVLIGLNYFY